MKITTLVALLFSSFSVFAHPGHLISLTHLNDTDAATAGAIRPQVCPDEKDVKKAYGIKRYKVTYITKDLMENEVQTNGILIVPDLDTSKNGIPLLDYQHGTVMGRVELPSSNPPNGEANAVGYCVSTLGYIVVSADYLGYGDGTGVHPYLHAASEAWTAIDLLRASKEALKQLDVKWNKQLFIAGYSQGGHAAMALLRALEEDPDQEFRVTAAAPMAGPYDLTNTVRQVPKAPTPHSPVEGAFILEGLNSVYGFYENDSEVFVPAFATLVAPLFDGTHTLAEAMTHLPATPNELIRADYTQAWENDPDHPFSMALADNDLYQWAPQTPIHLYQGGGDTEVPYANSVTAYNYMKESGARIKLINLGDKIDHKAGFPLAVGQAALWFETFVK